MRTFDTASHAVPGWMTAISPGPTGEAAQRVRFRVVADSGAAHFSQLPAVDSAGTLRFQGASAGTGYFRVRAHDNGDSTAAGSVNVSGWTSFSIALFSRPVLVASGPADTVRLVEDSVSTVSFAVQNFVGSSLAVKFSPVDTTLISAQSWKLIPDTNGKVSISAGPSNESGQKVRFRVRVTSGAGLFLVVPSVDSTGALSFTGKANTPGTAVFQAQAKDNGDSTGSNVDTSAWKTSTITFDVAPTLTLSDRTVSTWEGYPVLDTAALWSAGGGTLSVGWKISDTTLLGADSIVFPTSGSIRTFQLRPIPHRWGSAKIVFTATDSLGISGSDSLVLTVQPVNHAPVLSLKSPSLVATTWKGEQTFALASAVWDDASTTQTGRYDLVLSNPTDSVYLGGLRVDSLGMLHVQAKLDTDCAVRFRIRAHDNGGTAYGGVDTSAWSGEQVLQLVDTVLDADGNSYRARRMPDGKVWMRSNLYTKPRNGDTAYSCAGADLWDSTGGHLTPDCPKRGALYGWGTAMNQALGCDTLNRPGNLGGILV